MLLLLLMHQFFSKPGRGKISRGPTDALVQRTLEFVRLALPGWRDDSDRPQEDGEERLNAQLCKYLNVNAGSRFPMVHFSHEEKQTKNCRVDMSALPVAALIIGKMYHTIYDPFLVLEGKRLPAPSHDREKEYVTGGTTKLGGIQRFKLSRHGARQNTAAIIGYVQKGTLEDWHIRINKWICDLARDTASDDENWCKDEQLAEFTADHVMRTSSAWSRHSRKGSAISPEIRIRHLWVVMQS